MAEKKNLRFITYLSPGLPIDIFETIMHYLEDCIGKETSIVYESRWTGPPEDRIDPFASDGVDIGFMESCDFLRLYRSGDSSVSLCEAAPVHQHDKNTSKPVYYSDVIVHATNKTKFRELHGLRGHTFAYSTPRSLSGSLIVIENLKKMGFDTSFFGSLYESGSHLNSIRSVLNRRVDGAAVNSTVLQHFLMANPGEKDNVTVLTSFGPMPSYPVVFNSRLSDDLKKTITQALLSMHQHPEWGSKLQSLNIARFVPCDMTLYDMQDHITEAVKGMSIATTYY